MLSQAQINALLNKVWSYCLNSDDWELIDYDLNPELMQFYNFATKHKFTGGNLIYVMFDFISTGKIPAYMTKRQIQDLAQEKNVFLKVPPIEKSITLLYPRKKLIRDSDGNPKYYTDANGEKQQAYNIYFTFYSVCSVSDIEGFDTTWLEEDVVKTENEKYSEWIQKRFEESNSDFTADDYNYIMSTDRVREQIAYQKELMDEMFSDNKERQAFERLVQEFTLFMFAIETNTNFDIKQTAETVRQWVKSVGATKEQLYQAVSFANKRNEQMLSYGKQS